jgi:hypothetical protein
MGANKTLLKIAVPLTGLAVGALVLLVGFFLFSSWWSSPPTPFGFTILNLGTGPEQPIDFPHTVHVQEVGLDCQFCHRTASAEEAAGIPAVQQCLFCHDFGRIDGSEFDSSGNKVADTAKPEIVKLQEAFYGGTLEDGSELPPEPIDWVRVHRLPDHVQFLHQPHIQAGFSCSTCHGDVGSMEQVKQVRNLKMRDCVDCHRANNAPTDCTTCHY